MGQGGDGGDVSEVKQCEGEELSMLTVVLGETGKVVKSFVLRWLFVHFCYALGETLKGSFRSTLYWN